MIRLIMTDNEDKKLRYLIIILFLTFSAELYSSNEDYEKALYLYNSGEADSASVILENIISYGSADTKVYYLLGKIKYEGRDFEKSIEYLTVSIKLDSANFDSYYYRALSYHELSEYEYEAADLNAILNKKPEHYYTLKQRGMNLMFFGSYTEATEILEKATKLYPDSSEMRRTLGFVYLNQNRNMYAIMDFNKAIELNPDDYEAYNFRGRAYFALKEFDKSLKDFKKSIELKPDYPLVYNSIATVFINKNQPDSALYYCNIAIELDPEYADAYKSRGKIYLYELNKAEQGIEDLKTAIEKDQFLLNLYIEIALYYMGQKRPETALGYLNKAIEINPDYLEAYTHRADIHHAAGRKNEALKDLETALEIAKKLPKYSSLINKLEYYIEDLKGEN